MIKFDTIRYEGTHGRKPKGFGMWLFSQKRYPEPNEMFGPSNPMTLADAQKWVREHYKPTDRSVTYFYILP